MTTYLVGRLDRIVQRAIETLIEDQDVTVVGFTAMSVLAARPGLSNAELARRSFVTAQRMSQTLAVLAERGVIRRTPARNNRRIQRVELTKRGHQIVNVCTTRVARFEDELLSILSPTQRHELNSLLVTVVRSNRYR
jgi:DNA-binding MarR family transcriptional regulator